MGLFTKKEEVPSNKVGRVRKCPQCGAPVPSYKVACPECGWEFDDAADSGSAMARYRGALKESRKFFSSESEEDVVSSFNIPKSKNDLIEFTLYFKSKLRVYEQKTKPKTKEPFSIFRFVLFWWWDLFFSRRSDQYHDVDDDDLQMKDMYRARYEECIMKIQQYYPNDPDFSRILADYEQEKKEKKRKIIQKWIFRILCIIALVILLVYAINQF